MEFTLKEKTIIARKNRKLSQKDFAKLINSKQTEVSFIERGFVPENNEKIKKINKLYRSVVEGE